MVKHSKWYMFVVLAVALAAVAGGALYAANTQGNMPLYVANVEVRVVGTGGFGWGGLKGFRRWTGAAVLIVDQAGQPVSGATVRGTFTSCDEEYGQSGRTNAHGVAVMKGRRWSGCLHDFTVTSVTKNGWSWDPPVPLPSSSGNCNCN